MHFSSGAPDLSNKVSTGFPAIRRSPNHGKAITATAAAQQLCTFTVIAVVCGQPGCGRRVTTYVRTLHKLGTSQTRLHGTPLTCSCSPRTRSLPRFTSESAGSRSEEVLERHHQCDGLHSPAGDTVTQQLFEAHRYLQHSNFDTPASLGCKDVCNSRFPSRFR